MQFDSFSDFIAMGGYGLYVWSAFSVSLFVMILVFAQAYFKTSSLRQELAKQKQREEKLKLAKEMEGTL